MRVRFPLGLPTFLLALCVLAASVAAAQGNAPPGRQELDQITERGRLLAEYDAAAWHSTDAVMALKPAEGSFTRYVARKTAAGWVVAWGCLSEQGDRFLIVYEATQGAKPTEFSVKRHEPPLEDTSFFLNAARALGTAVDDFRGEQRPYNAAVLPAESGQFYVYILPAQTKNGVYPLGGDVCCLVSADGSKILEKRQLHKTILDRESGQSGKVLAGVHTHILDNIPGETDVFHVLSRKPSTSEVIISEKFVYIVNVNGTIVCQGEREKVLGKKK